MNAYRWLVAAVAAVLVAFPVVTGPPAAADPTLDPIVPPTPAQVPQQSNPAPVSTVSDEDAIRQVIQALYATFNAQNFEGIRGFYCADLQAIYSPDGMRATYNDTGPLTVTIPTVEVTGDSAIATLVGTAPSDNSVATQRVRMVREGGWKMCGSL